MLLGVMSDTHDDVESIEVALEIMARAGVDMVIHLGDLVSPFSLRPIVDSGIPCVLLAGNNEGEFKVAVDAINSDITFYPGPVEMELTGRKILLMHGFGPASLTKRVAELLAGSGAYDVVMYGHTHELDSRRMGGAILLNPGEVCGILTGKKTVALLDLSEMSVDVIRLDVGEEKV